MTRRFAAAFILACLAAGGAAACPEPSEELVFHSCWGEAEARIALLPEETLGPPPESGVRIAVTGAYTAEEARDGDAEGAGPRPNPVGFFMHEGRLVNPNMTRMDGMLIVDPGAGTLSLHNRAAVELGGRTYNLRRVAPRRDFAAEARERGLSVLQSHLLIIDGKPDVSDVEDAPEFRRRILFTDADGYGVFETAGAVTLYDAAMALDERHDPQMALNLDMGSYDFCFRAEDGVERRCGVVARQDTGKLSNLIVLTVQ